MKLFKISSAIIIFSTTMAGCSTFNMTTQFKKMYEPTSGERARIRVTANMFVKGIPNSSCQDWSKEGAGTIWGGILGTNGYRKRSLNMPNPEGFSNKTSGEFYAQADQPIVIVLANTPESRMTCNISGTFIPQANKDYQVNMSTGMKGAFKSICKMQVSEITPKGLVPISIKEAKYCE